MASAKHYLKDLKASQSGFKDSVIVKGKEKKSQVGDTITGYIVSSTANLFVIYVKTKMHFLCFTATDIVV